MNKEAAVACVIFAPLLEECFRLDDLEKTGKLKIQVPGRPAAVVKGMGRRVATPADVSRATNKARVHG